jgi:hypothetical protein
MAYDATQRSPQPGVLQGNIPGCWNAAGRPAELDILELGLEASDQG